MGIQKIDQKLCTGCEVCVDDCPMDVIRMNEETGKAYVAYPGDCHSCLQCEESCPVDAVDMKVELARQLWFSY